MLTPGTVTHCVQALRLDVGAGLGLTNRSLMGIASMGGRLQQLALLGLQHVSDGSLTAALAQLPMLQVIMSRQLCHQLQIRSSACNARLHSV
jgi:hypothetical protein